MLGPERRVTHEALMRATDITEMQRLRDLVRNIEVEEEPTRLEVLFEQLRTLVGLSQPEIASPSPSATGPAVSPSAEE